MRTGRGSARASVDRSTAAGVGRRVAGVKAGPPDRVVGLELEPQSAAGRQHWRRHRVAAVAADQRRVRRLTIPHLSIKLSLLNNKRPKGL